MSGGLEPSYVLVLLGEVQTFWARHGTAVEGLAKITGVVFIVAGGWVWARRFARIFKHWGDAVDAAHYSELDRFYAEILRQAIALPHLRMPRRVTDEAALSEDYTPYSVDDPDAAIKAVQYDAYAYMVWNFLEAIRDRCAERPKLKATWAPVIGAENAIHRSWFLAQIRNEELRARDAVMSGEPYVASDKFCVGFQVFVVRNQWQQKNGAYASWQYGKAFQQPSDFRRSLAFGGPK